jgi:Fe-S oxidoreductase
MTTTTIDTAGPTTEGCRYCWMCRQACPVGHVTAREALTPHAWALTIESVKRGQLTWNPETVGILYACADCGLCRAHCATDRPLPDAIAEARAEVAAAGTALPIVYELDARLQAHANPYAPVAPIRATGQGATALFVGDAGQHLGAATVAAAVKLLSAAGVTAVPIAAGRSTGALASSLGLVATAKTLAAAALADVAASGCRDLLVMSPGDKWAFDQVYRDRLDISWPAGVKVTEVTMVLDEALSGGRLRLTPLHDAPAYAYHDPCHAPRIDRDAGAPRRLLAAALGQNGARQLFWREGRAHPCGATGGLDFTHPAIATRLTEARVSDAKAVGAKWLVTEDPACLHQLGLSGAPEIEAHGLYELLAAQL